MVCDCAVIAAFGKWCLFIDSSVVAKSKNNFSRKKSTMHHKQNHLYLTSKVVWMFTPTFQLNYTANRNILHSSLLTKKIVWMQHDIITRCQLFNLPLNPSWNMVCDSVVPASCYLHEYDCRKKWNVSWRSVSWKMYWTATA